MRASILALLAVSCTPDETTASSELVAVDPGTVSEVQVVPTVGTSTLSVPVRLNNNFGLAIPGGTPPVVSVDGPGASLLTEDFTPDTFGVTTVEVAASGPAAITVTADGGAGTVWSVSGVPDILAIRGGAYPIDAPLAALSATGTGGSAFAGDDEIWWQPSAPGAPAWRTADLPSTVEGMWPTQIDSDGVLDLAVWAGEQVYLLRGWPGGGYAWGAAWSIPGGDVVGLSATDVDGDRLTDLVIGVDYGEDARVELLLGDGAWGFAAQDPLELTFGISTITAADENLDGHPDISMLRSIDGVIRRYSYLDNGWSGGTPSQITMGSDATLVGGTLQPMVDLNGDGDLELVAEGPKGASSQRLVFFSFAGDTIIKYEQAYANYWLDIADMEGDGAADVIALEDGTVHLTRFDGSGGSFVAQNFSDISEAGPVAASDVDGDALLDLTVFGDAPTHFLGALSEGAASRPGDGDCIDGEDNDKDGNIDGDDAQCGGWRLASYTWRTFGLNLDGVYTTTDVNGDGSDDIIGYVDGSGGYSLETWRTDVGDDGFVQLLPGTGYELYNDGTPLDLAVCGDDIYSLYQTTSGITLLVRLESDGSGGLDQERANNGVRGTLLACGALGGDDVAVVSTTGGDWVAYERDRLDEVDSGFIEAANGIAIANDAVVGCETVGCSVIAGDTDGDGVDEVFRSEASGVTVEGWGATTALAGSGSLRAVDGDSDGLMEALLTDAASQRALWYTGVPGGIAPATSWWRDAAVGGTATLADLDQDGIPELLVPTAEGGLSHSPTH